MKGTGFNLAFIGIGTLLVAGIAVIAVFVLGTTNAVKDTSAKVKELTAEIEKLRTEQTAGLEKIVSASAPSQAKTIMFWTEYGKRGIETPYYYESGERHSAPCSVTKYVNITKFADLGWRCQPYGTSTSSVMCIRDASGGPVDARADIMQVCSVQK